MFDRVLPIISSSMQSDVYTVLYLSEISLPRADIFPDLIILTSPHELSKDHIPFFSKLSCKLQHQGLWLTVKSISNATYDYFHHEYI